MTELRLTGAVRTQTVEARFLLWRALRTSAREELVSSPREEVLHLYKPSFLIIDALPIRRRCGHGSGPS